MDYPHMLQHIVLTNRSNYHAIYGIIQELSNLQTSFVLFVPIHYVLKTIKAHFRVSVSNKFIIFSYTIVCMIYISV